MPRVRQIVDDLVRCSRCDEIQHTHAVDALARECTRVTIVSDLENAPAQIARVLAKERLDVAAVHRRPAIEAEIGGDRLRTPQAPEADRPSRRPRRETASSRGAANAYRDNSA